MKIMIFLLCLALAPCVYAGQWYFGTTAVQAGDTITNTNTATLFSTRLMMDATLPIDQRYGQTYEVTGYGVISTAASPGTLTLSVVQASGNVVSPTIYTMGTTGAFTPPASLTAAPVVVQGEVVYSTTGNGNGIATFFGVVTIQGASNAVTMYGIVPTGMATGTVGWNSTMQTQTSQVNAIALQGTWGTASTGNIITLALFFKRLS